MARRSRVLSFMSQWSSEPRSLSEPPRAPQSPTNYSQSNGQQGKQAFAYENDYTADNQASGSRNTQHTRQSFQVDHTPPASPSAAQRTRAGSRAGSRPVSMVQTYQPPVMEVAQDTLPELQPIFTYLNSHSNKLYQEGYFLKLHDLDARGRPSASRDWQECFAQLAGTVLSLWDAAELDAAGEEGEVIPSFINLADASIKMLESLPMNEGGQVLNNVLSISTAANNRYLLHFNSLNSLTQWTAGIRLALFEYSGLQEAYTGSLIAGKGRTLNNIRTIMDRTKWKQEDWCRVRFGAGTPWRRCWFVISPPDEKEIQKHKKMYKKASPYEKVPILKGDLKFYESKKIGKKTRPIATVTDGWSAYAVYPQSKPLIDQSTLVKIEGRITIHSSVESTADGFVFVMPEVHPAVSGFEMMLRFLFPIWDVFALYGRPNKLIAETLDTRGLMFAMPRDRRYGYLELLDVCGLIHTDGAQGWGERQWRKQMKELTAKRMLAMGDDSSIDSTERVNAIPGNKSQLRFGEAPSRTDSPVQSARGRQSEEISSPKRRSFMSLRHRSASASRGADLSRRQSPQQGTMNPSAFPVAQVKQAPIPPAHGVIPIQNQHLIETSEEYEAMSARELAMRDAALSPELRTLRSPVPEPVAAPPSMAHAPSERPKGLNQAPELRRGQSYLDQDTINQLVEATTPGLQARGEYGFPDSIAPLPLQAGMNGLSMGEPHASAGAAHRGVGNIDTRSERAFANQIPQGPPVRSPTSPRSTQSGLPPLLPILSISPGSGARTQPSQHAPVSTNLSKIRGALDVTSPVSPVTTSPTDMRRSNDDFHAGSLAAAITTSTASRPGTSDRSEPAPQDNSMRRSSTNFSVPRKPVVSRGNSSASVYSLAGESAPVSGSSNTAQAPPAAESATQRFYANARNMPPVDDGVDRPRMGRMKTIGSDAVTPKESVVMGDVTYSQQNPVSPIDIPDFSFGPTYRLDPGARTGPPIPPKEEPASAPAAPVSITAVAPVLSRPPTNSGGSRPGSSSRPVSRPNSRPGTSHGHRPTLHTPTGSQTHLPLRPAYAHQDSSPHRMAPRQAVATSHSRGNSQTRMNVDRDGQHRHILGQLDLVARDLPTWPITPQDVEEVPYDGMRVPAALYNALQQFRPRGPHPQHSGDDARDRAEKGRIYQLSNLVMINFQDRQRQLVERQINLQHEVAAQQAIVMQQQQLVHQSIANANFQHNAISRPSSSGAPPGGGNSMRSRLQKRLSGTGGASRSSIDLSRSSNNSSPVNYTQGQPPLIHSASNPNFTGMQQQQAFYQQQHGSTRQLVERSSSYGSGLANADANEKLQRPTRQHQRPPKSFMGFGMDRMRSRSRSRDRAGQ